MKLVRLEWRVAIEVVGERLLQVGLDGRGQAKLLAQHLARRQRDNELRGGGTGAIGGLGQGVDHGAPCLLHGRGISDKRNACRGRVGERAVARTRHPQHRDILREREDGPQHPALQRCARHRGDQRGELSRPPAPEGGQPEPVRVFAQPLSKVSG